MVETSYVIKKIASTDNFHVGILKFKKYGTKKTVCFDWNSTIDMEIKYPKSVLGTYHTQPNTIMMSAVDRDSYNVFLDTFDRKLYHCIETFKQNKWLFNFGPMIVWEKRNYHRGFYIRFGKLIFIFDKRR